MRFAAGLLDHQTPLWSDFYPDYQRWKFLLKADKLPELEEDFNHYAGLVSPFLEQRATAVERLESAVASRYGSTLERRSQEPVKIALPELQELVKIALPELHDLRESLREIISQLTLTGAYVKVTQKAVERICTKASWPLPPEDGAQLVPNLLGHLWQALCRSAETVRESIVRINRDLGHVEHSIFSTAAKLHRDSVLLLRLRQDSNIEDIHGAKELLFGDQSTNLAGWLKDAGFDESTDAGQALLRALAYVAIIHQSRGCLDILLPKLRQVKGDEKDPWATYLHLFVICIGRRYRIEKERELQAVEEIRQLFGALQTEELHAALHRRDPTGRLPLHYAAEYGLPGVCNEILKLMGEPEEVSSWVLSLSTQDFFFDSPIHVAVALGHDKAVEVLVSHLQLKQDRSSKSQETARLCQGLVLLAIRSRFPRIANLIRSLGKVLLHSGLTDSRVLHMASRFGSQAAVEALLDTGVSPSGTNVPFGQTPLIVAAIHDHFEVAKVLIEAGCDLNARDFRGWRAIEHAAFRGLPKMVELLERNRGKVSGEGIPALPKSDSKRRKRQTFRAQSKGAEEDGQAISHIFAHLGSLDLERPVPNPLDIETYRRKWSPPCLPDFTLALKISSPGSVNGPYWVHFPILEDLTYRPWRFDTADLDRATIVFELFTSVSEHHRPLAVGVALLGQLCPSLEGGRESLVRAHTVPLVNPNVTPSIKDGLAGTLTFTFVVARPFASPGPTPTPAESLPRHGFTIVGGRRGLGQNDKKHQHLQLGENTLDSFNKAAKLGAQVLEFNVQVTKNLVPVIYHDFLVSETGIDAPMHQLTLDEFMVLSDVQSMPAEARFVDGNRAFDENRKAGVHKLRRINSANSLPAFNTSEFIDRMKPTLGYSSSAFKPNIRGECIHSPFATLEDSLTKLDKHICFDIEIKYPMLYESRYWKMDTFAIELNLFLDTILAVVYKHAGARPIFFSSFSPEVCMVFAAKRTVYPILFLNDSSNRETFDARAMSVQSAVHFAREFNLDGLVMASEPLVAAPALIQTVKDQGLYIASYGAQNDEVEHAKTQASGGLDCILVNKVRKVALALER